VFCSYKILTEHEREELHSNSGENNDELTVNAEEALPAVVAYLNPEYRKNNFEQFRRSSTAKGKFGFSTGAQYFFFFFLQFL